MPKKKQLQLKPFPTSRILTVSADSYMQSTGKAPTEYKMVGVHYLGRTDRPVESLAQHVPTEAEVVVDYTLNIMQHTYQYTTYGSLCSENKHWVPALVAVDGTVLIPREANKKRK